MRNQARAVLCLLVFVLLWLNALPVSSHVAPQTSVNAVIGDISYYQRFGRLPSETVDENLRISTHLNYVEKLLRSRVPSSVPAELLPRRRQMLDLLQAYREQGVFPRQRAFEGRRPHFIDEQGRLCAVGYLVAKTASPGLAQRINRQYRYSYLPEMESSELRNWAAASGLTLEELAMIQPTYGDDFGSPTAELAYYIPVLTLMAIQAVATVFHIAVLAGPVPEWYRDIQTYDVMTTVTSLGLLLLLTLAAPLVPGLGSDDKLVMFLVGPPIAGVFGVSNLLMLHHLDLNSRPQSNQLELGLFQTHDRQATWGLHASLSF